MNPKLETLRTSLAHLEPYLEQVKEQWDGEADGTEKDRAMAAYTIQECAATILSVLSELEDL